MKQKLIYLLSISILVFLISTNEAHSQSGNGNIVPLHCECIKFVYACSGLGVDLPGAQVHSRCVDPDPESPVYAGRYRSLQDSFYCSPHHCFEGWTEKICFSYGNWHICGGINGCQAKIFQTLSIYPYINGQLIGYGSGAPWGGGSGACLGRLYPGPLNYIEGRTELNTCPGEDVYLKISGLDLPEESGLCLQVRFKDEDGNPVISEMYNHNDIFVGTGGMASDSIDITDIYGALSPGIYEIEMRLRCCDGDLQDCTQNTFKSAFIEIAGPLSFNSFLSQGGGSSGCNYMGASPSPDFPGPVFQTPLELDLSNYPPDIIVVRNCPVMLNINNVSNDQDLPLEIKLREIENCDFENGDRLLRFNETIIPDENGYSTPLVSNHTTSDCRCFELTLIYEGCDSEIVEQVSYFQVGDDCVAGLGGILIDKSLKGNAQQAGSIKVWPNPVGNDLYIDITKVSENFGDEFKFEIYDVNGRHVLSTQLPTIIGTHNIPLDLPAGIFLYRISSNNFNLVDRFVKK